MKKEGFVNRHTHGLPDKITTLRIVDGENVYLCEWKPFDKNHYSKENMPAEGYLGTAEVIEGGFKGIGFHAWEQNNSEFVWYTVAQEI